MYCLNIWFFILAPTEFILTWQFADEMYFFRNQVGQIRLMQQACQHLLTHRSSVYFYSYESKGSKQVALTTKCWCKGLIMAFCPTTWSIQRLNHSKWSRYKGRLILNQMKLSINQWQSASTKTWDTAKDCTTHRNSRQKKSNESSILKQKTCISRD
jgi:hypothetical protein